MRCPSCGNENPDDYTFCDECGARLTPQEGEANAAPASDAAYVSDSDPISTPLEMPGNADSMGAGAMPAGPINSGPMDAASAATATAAPPAVCPNCGAPTVPGEAYCNECGAELATAGSASTMQPAPDAQGGEPGSTVGIGIAPVVPASTATADQAAVPPTTEDTMPSGSSDVYESALPTGPAQGADMPGVTPLPAGPEPTGAAAQPDAGAVAPAAGPADMSAGGGQPASWAQEALRQLEEAQQAMARGDFVAYGQFMSTLKSHLESAAGGGAAGSAAMPAGATAGAGAAPGVAPVAAPASPPAPAPLPGMPAPLADQSGAEPGAAATNGQDAYQNAGMARLVVIATGAELPLPQQEEITVGREDPSSGIFPDIDLTPYGGEDGGVSRRHARMLHIGNDYFVEDLQSTNYTKLDGQRLPARVREKLEDGARLDFGRVAMIFRKG